MVIHDATEPERLVMEVFPRGNLVDLTNGSRPFDDPSQGERWGQERTVRADVIRHLLTGGVPDERGEVAALHLTGIRIVGILDLAHAHIKYPVYFQRCWFAEPPNLRWQGHVKITACAEFVTLSDELWNTAALVFPAQSTLSLKCSL